MAPAETSTAPRDTASIDPEDDDLQWYFDIAGGTTTIASGLHLDARPVEVARWITEQARRVGSPAIRHIAR